MSDLSYPRPDFDRSERWISLDGEWQFARGDSRDDAEFVGSDADFPETILVPFPWESARSGVGADWLEQGWYRRQIEVPTEWGSERTILHFGGVQERASVYVNGVRLDTYQGGSGDLECDVTNAAGPGQALLVVGVHNPIDKSLVCHGKQRSVPPADYDNCSFRPSSGIWQSVWMEPRPATYLYSVGLSASPALDAIWVEAVVAGSQAGDATLELALRGSAERQTVTVPPDGRVSVLMPVADARPWSPADPHLYFLEAALSTKSGVDKVTVYTGLRQLEVVGDELRLNGVRLSVRGVLDQGYWPDTGWTAPNVNALRKDLELAKAAGYNLVRKHVKLEDPRWLYLADTMGMLVWEEPPSPSRYSDAVAGAFLAAVGGMVARDGNHPAIVIWGLYNEEWGLDWAVLENPRLQEVVRETVKLLRSLDATRPIVDNSGWAHVATDIVDWHYYEVDLDRWCRNLPALIAGGDAKVPVPLRPPAIELKRLGVDVDAVSRRPSIASEYGAGLTSVDRAWFLKWQTQELRRYDRLTGYVYTELYDVEYETFGIYTAWRDSKDLANLDLAAVNAETVIIVDIVPERPGLDARASGGRLEVDLRVSHHGRAVLSGRLVGAWGPVLSATPPRFPPGEIVDCVVELRVEPFVVTGPCRFYSELPGSVDAGRLHLGFECDGILVARSVIDVVRAGSNVVGASDGDAILVLEEEPE